MQAVFRLAQSAEFFHLFLTATFRAYLHYAIMLMIAGIDKLPTVNAVARRGLWRRHCRWRSGTCERLAWFEGAPCQTPGESPSSWRGRRSTGIRLAARLCSASHPRVISRGAVCLTAAAKPTHQRARLRPAWLKFSPGNGRTPAGGAAEKVGIAKKTFDASTVRKYG